MTETEFSRPLRVEPDLVQDPSLNGFGRILPPFDHAMINPLAQIALSTLGHMVGFGGDRLDRFFADHRVVAVEEHNDDMKVTVRFNSVGVKKLLAKYAKLEPA